MVKGYGVMATYEGTTGNALYYGGEEDDFIAGGAGNSIVDTLDS